MTTLLFVLWLVLGIGGGWLAGQALARHDWPKFVLWLAIAGLGIACGVAGGVPR